MGFFKSFSNFGKKVSSSSRPRGPVVKSGPTFGKVRSRTKLGRWRRKRSDAWL